MAHRTLPFAALSCFVFAVLGCSGGGGDPGTLQRIGGTISGLDQDGLVLQLNEAEQLPVAAGETSFQFSTAIAAGGLYSVTVLQQPPQLACTVEGHSGRVSGDVSDIRVVCGRDAFLVRGTATGLSGAGLVLGLNGQALQVPADGPFEFPGAIPTGAQFAVIVTAAPEHQDCAVEGGAGVIGSADVTDVAVTCTTRTYPVGGTVSGLAGSGLVLRLNAQDLPITQNGAFEFPSLVAEGSTYAVSVRTQPLGPAQTCSIGGTASGVVVGSVQLTVACSTVTYRVRASVSGMTATGLQLRLNGGTARAISQNGTYEFPDALADGTLYAVTVARQPTGQMCVVVGGAGTVRADVLVAVTCSRYDAWAVGDNGTILRWVGGSWVDQSPGGSTLRAVWGSAANDVWAVGDGGTILHFNGSTWSSRTTGTTTTADLYAVWGISSSNVWAVGSGVVLRWNGSAWTTTAVSADLTGVWGSSASDVWAVGNGALLRNTGSGFVPYTGSGAFAAYGTITGTSASDVWAMFLDSASNLPDMQNRIKRWNGTTWTDSLDLGYQTPKVIWARAANDVWFHAAQFRSPTLWVWRYTGSWATLGNPAGNTTMLPEATAFWGGGTDDMWIALESSPGALHWDGSAWAEVSTGTTEVIRGLWGFRN